MLIAILGGLGASLGWAAADIYIKRSVDKISSILSLFLFRLGTLICALPLLFADSTMPDLDFKIYLIIFGFAFTQIVIMFLLFTAFKYGKVSFVTPIVSTYTLISAVVSFTFFGEDFDVGKMLFAGLVYFGIILTGVGIAKESKKKNPSPAKKNSLYSFAFAFAVMLAYALYFPAFDWFIDRDGWGVLIVLESLLVTVLLVPLVIKKRKEIVKTSKKLFWIAFFAGILNGIGNIALALGFEFSKHTTVTIAATSSTSAVAVIFAYIFLKERMTRLQYIGIGAVIIGLLFPVFL
ncbi:DMT family transporter [Candidatus Dojkabacteria bacterium]|nr:DMT family transporter [Candidatus Dojkabacteria bacterium]